MTKTTAATEEKKRKRRIASDEAHAWARNLRLKNPYAKMILMDLSHHVDGEGFCFVGLSSVAEDCELALETIRKRLTWLEEIGAIARFPQWIDENGRRNGEGRGKRTTDKIRLMLDANDDDIEALARGDRPPEDDGEPSEISPPSDEPVRGLNQPAEDAPETVSPLPAPQLGVYWPPTCVGGLTPSNLNLEPEPEDSPPSPPSVPRADAGEGVEDSNGQASEPDTDDLAGWQEFKKAYEADGDTIVKTSLPMTLFRALNIEQRALLTKAARGLVFARRQQKSTRPKPAPQTFIRETESWESWATHAPPLAAEFHRIEPESIEAVAYLNICRFARAVRPREIGGAYILRRAMLPSEVAFKDIPADKAWGFVEASNQIASWMDFLHPLLGHVARRPLIEEHRINGVLRKGFLAPWPWPPLKDGTPVPWPSQQSPPGETNAA